MGFSNTRHDEKIVVLIPPIRIYVMHPHLRMLLERDKTLALIRIRASTENSKEVKKRGIVWDEPTHSYQ
jgi:hypothetical protein